MLKKEILNEEDQRKVFGTRLKMGMQVWMLKNILTGTGIRIRSTLGDLENSKIGSQLIFHQVADTLPVVPRTHYCPQQTQVAIAPDCGVLDPVVEQSYMNST